MADRSLPTPHRAENPRDVARGLGLVVLAMIVLPGQDTIAKYISDTVSPGTLTWARFLMQSLFTLPFLIYFQGAGGLVPRRLWPNVVRGALIAGSSTMFFAAIKFMPLADALAIFFIEPFILTILSAVVEKEHVGWRRRTAVATGFVGVLIVVQPSWDVFGPISLVPALGGGLFAVYVLMNRRLSAYDTPLTMQFTAGVSAFVVMTLVLAVSEFAGIPELSPSTVGAREVAFLLLMGVLGTSGHLFFVQASRLAPSSLIAPMQYVEIVCAALLGYLVFGDFPSLVKWIGILIIVGSGAYVFFREGKVGRRRAGYHTREGEWTKADLINRVAEAEGYRTHLEIAVPTTGQLFGEVDGSRLTCQRLIYGGAEDWSDGQPIDFRSPTLDISACLSEIAERGLRCDVILVDSWHAYDPSLRDIREAFALLSPGGTLFVHDCLPPNARFATPEFRAGGWCGVSYKAFLDFVLDGDLDYCIVDTDFGCGVIRKPKAGEAPRFESLIAPEDAGERKALVAKWRGLGPDYAAALRMLTDERRLLGKVVSVDRFLRFYGLAADDS